MIDQAGAGLSVKCPNCSRDLIVPPPVNPAPQSQTEPKRRGRVSVFSKLTERSIFERNADGDTRLHQAIRNRKFQLVPQAALSEEIFLVPNKLGRTPLHYAAQYGCIEQVPPQYLTPRTLSAKNSGGSTPIHAAALAGHLDKIPVSVLTRELLNIRNNSGATPLEWQQQNSSATQPTPATEKQKGYLRDLGATFAESITIDDASDLIQNTLSQRKPTPRQIEHLRRLGLLDELDEDDTALDVSDWLKQAVNEPPSDYLLARANELGLRIFKTKHLTAEHLSDILILADQQPSAETLAELKAVGLAKFSGSALAAFIILDLASAYHDLEWNLQHNEIAAACMAAIRDPTFFSPTIEGGYSLNSFLWSKTKMHQWVREGKLL